MTEEDNGSIFDIHAEALHAEEKMLSMLRDMDVLGQNSLVINNSELLTLCGGSMNTKAELISRLSAIGCVITTKVSVPVDVRPYEDYTIEIRW